MNQQCYKKLHKVKFSVISQVTKDGYNLFKAYRDLRLYFIEQPMVNDGEGEYNLSITNVTQNHMRGYR